MKPRVNQLGGKKSLSFLLTWKELNTNLILNFEPIVNNNNLKTPWVIGHFQAVPFGHRSFGYVYCKNNKEVEYTTLYSNEINIKTCPRQIDIPEDDLRFIDVRPTAVYVFEKSGLFQVNNTYEISYIYGD